MWKIDKLSRSRGNTNNDNDRVKIEKSNMNNCKEVKCIAELKNKMIEKNHQISDNLDDDVLVHCNMRKGNCHKIYWRNNDDGFLCKNCNNEICYSCSCDEAIADSDNDDDLYCSETCHSDYKYNHGDNTEEEEEEEEEEEKGRKKQRPYYRKKE